MIHTFTGRRIKTLYWSIWGTKIDIQHVTLLRFADDIKLISNKVREPQELLNQWKEDSEKVGFRLNLSKAKIMTEQNIGVEIDGNEIENTWNNNTG